MVPPSNPASTVTSSSNPWWGIGTGKKPRQNAHHERQAQRTRQTQSSAGGRAARSSAGAEHAEARNKSRQQGHDRQLDQQVTRMVAEVLRLESSKLPMGRKVISPSSSRKAILAAGPAIHALSSAPGMFSCLPPPTKCTTSNRSPGWMMVSAQVDRAAISRLRSTATRSAGNFNQSSNAARSGSPELRAVPHSDRCSSR